MASWSYGHMQLTDDVPGLLGGLFRFMLYEKAGKICEEDGEDGRAFDARYAAKEHAYLTLAFDTIVRCMHPKLRDDLLSRRNAILGEILQLS